MKRGLWFPETKRWEGEACYIIGGGHSLTGFDFACLKGRNVLGCNVAFYMGYQLVPITIFGDAKFLNAHLPHLRKYAAEGGEVISPARRVDSPPEWLKVMRKQLHGLSLSALGWNGNTGAAAINLALLFGADPVFLLGYDMQVSDGGLGNFHNAYAHTVKPEVYLRFKKGMGYVARDLPKLFPGQRVINLEDDTSALTDFPMESLKGHFASMEVCNGTH